MRQFGVLLHISSLPSAYGIGDLGPAAHAFARALGEAGASLWQFLPVNPTSTYIGNSPYSSASAFAGNPLFISPEYLVRDGYLSHADLECARCVLPGGQPGLNPSQVDYAAVSAHRGHILFAAYERNCHTLQYHADFLRFCAEHHFWLHDYARFVSLKDEHGGVSWVDWPKPLCLRDPDALTAWDTHAAHAIRREKFIQYLFFSQWEELRGVCRELRLSLLADVPIYVTHDSADVWAAPRFFNLDERMQPVTVSGVPPDYFSETGQRWGTPVYQWDALEAEGFLWWKQRLGHVLRVADMARLDHFRGFCGYWDVPAEEKTAMKGVWKLAPAKALFTALREHFKGLPFVAEDLGVITEDVRAAMRFFGLPGMHVLQFAFGGPDMAGNPSIPHAQTPASVVYTGTHDNIPTKAWFHNMPRYERENFMEYAGVPVTMESVTSVLIRIAFAGVADYAIVPMQDVLNLGAEARMNTPGLASDNWTWRLTEEQARPEHLAWLTEFARLYGRLNRKEDPRSEPVDSADGIPYPVTKAMARYTDGRYTDGR